MCISVKWSYQCSCFMQFCQNKLEMHPLCTMSFTKTWNCWKYSPNINDNYQNTAPWITWSLLLCGNARNAVKWVKSIWNYWRFSPLCKIRNTKRWNYWKCKHLRKMRVTCIWNYWRNGLLIKTIKANWKWIQTYFVEYRVLGVQLNRLLTTNQMWGLCEYYKSINDNKNH